MFVGVTRQQGNRPLVHITVAYSGLGQGPRDAPFISGGRKLRSGKVFFFCCRRRHFFFFFKLSLSKGVLFSFFFFFSMLCIILVILDFQCGGGKFLEVKNGASVPAVALARRRSCLRGDMPPQKLELF